MTARFAIDEAALHFFNRLDAALIIELSEPTSQLAPHVLNQVAPPSGQITNISLSVAVVENDDEDDEYHRELTEAEWKRVVLRTPILRLRGMGSDQIFEHNAPDGATFTTRDLVAAIVETERQTRSKTEWFGGIDMQHIFFGGMSFDEDGVWSAGWDS